MCLFFAKVENKNKQCYNVMQRLKSNNNVTIRGIRILWGVILTGMGSDGARGLLAMRKRGAHTIGEDEKSCVVYGMPKVAYDIGAVQYQEPLENIASKIYNILNVCIR